MDVIEVVFLFVVTIVVYVFVMARFPKTTVSIVGSFVLFILISLSQTGSPTQGGAEIVITALAAIILPAIINLVMRKAKSIKNEINIRVAAQSMGLGLLFGGGLLVLVIFQY